VHIIQVFTVVTPILTFEEYTQEMEMK